MICVFAVFLMAVVAAPAAAQDQPNILVVWGDDVGQSNISAYTKGMMG
jgi:arylsulfatase